MIEFRDATDAVTQRNYPQGQYVGTTAYFYMRDHIGSIREMFTGGGTVVARYDYDPYGRSTTVLGTTPTDFNFTGLYRHAKSNLDLAVYRAYDPDLGRWLSRDPIGELGGLNLYAYVANNSTHWIDRAGLAVECKDLYSWNETRKDYEHYEYSKRLRAWDILGLMSDWVGFAPTSLWLDIYELKETDYKMTLMRCTDTCTHESTLDIREEKKGSFYYTTYGMHLRPEWNNQSNGA